LSWKRILCRNKCLKKKDHKSLGANITESRLSLINSLYGFDSRVLYIDLIDNNNNSTGTRVEITLPYI